VKPFAIRWRGTARRALWIRDHAIILGLTPSRQGAFLGRDTASVYPEILNHLGHQYDDNAPKEVPDELMRAVGHNDAILRIQAQLAALPHEMRDSF